MARIVVTLMGVCCLLGSVSSASAQSYGGIKRFVVPFPIQTYEKPQQGQRLQASSDLLSKDDAGAIENVLIIAVYGLNGSGYVELETKSGDYWIRRDHVEPLRASLIDKQIDESNGNIVCPPGATLVARTVPRDEQSGVARNLGGQSASCIKTDLR